MTAEATVELACSWRDGGAVDAVLRPLRGTDEEWLRELDRHTPLPRVVTDVLARCVRRIGDVQGSSVALGELSLADRERLILAAWELAFGPNLQLPLDCPTCGAGMDADLDVRELPPGRPEAAGIHGAAGIRFRLPTGDDLEAIAGEPEPVLVLLRRCLVDGDAATAIATPALRAAIEAEMERFGPATGELDAVCPECGETFATPLDLAGSLMAELGRRQQQLDADVHLLSVHYHWPLREILRLPRLRRRAYVERLLARLEPGAA